MFVITFPPPPLQYLGELSLVDSDPFLKYLPSQTAAAAYILANNTVTGGSWVSLNRVMAPSGIHNSVRSTQIKLNLLEYLSKASKRSSFSPSVVTLILWMHASGTLTLDLLCSLSPWQRWLAIPSKGWCRALKICTNSTSVLLSMPSNLFGKSIRAPSKWFKLVLF